MANFPKVPPVATDVNYAAGSETWSGTPTKVAPNSGYETKGWTPAQPIPAQYENYHKAQVNSVAQDNQFLAAIKVASSGLITTAASGGFSAHLPRNKALLGISADGSNNLKLVLRSADYNRTRSTTVYTHGAPVTAWNLTATYEILGFCRVFRFPYGATNGSTANRVVLDDQSLATNNLTLPGTAALYTDGCKDISTGRAILASGGSTQHGFASGDLSSLTFVATSGHTANAFTTCASKPGQTRAFSVGTTFATSDGGTTVGAANATSWTGAGAPPHMFRPAWVPTFNKWIVSTVDLDSGQSTANSTSKLWTSTNGIDWTFYLDLPGKVLTQIVEYKGWLWAIGIPTDNSTTDVGGPRLEIYFSVDYGLTWKRTGHVLSFLDSFSGLWSSATLDQYIHGSKITPAGNFLVFESVMDGLWQTTLQVGYDH